MTGRLALCAGVLAGAFSIVPGFVVAQQAAQAEQATFYLLSHAAGGSDTIVSERSTRTAKELRGELLASNGGRTTYTATLTPDGLVSRLEMQAFRGPTDQNGAKLSFVLGGDSIVARVGTADAAHLPGTNGALVIVNPSMAFFEQMLMRAKALGGEKVGIPLFVVGAPGIVPLTVEFIGTDSATIQYANASMRFAVSPTGRLLGGIVPAQKLTISRGAAVLSLAVEKPDYTAPANAPYTAEDVVVRTPAGLKLTGTLTMPRGRATGRAPAVVTITGSGSEDRDGQPVAALKGYQPFRELADSLGRRGIAVLRLDDRGVNGSDVGPLTATSNDFADDIRAGVAYLRSRPEVDAARIALVGHSEGGMVAQIVAAKETGLRALVLMAAAGSPGRDILLSQQHYMIDTMLKLTGDQRTAALSQSQRATDSMVRAMPWMKLFVEHDPSIVARRVTTPVLIVQGLTDHQVPAGEAEKLASAFRSGGNANVTVRTFPATNHLFVADSIGSFDYARLPSLHVRPTVLSAIGEWLTQQFSK